MARIIGFIGLAGSGKDTAAKAMLQEFQRQGHEACISGFADPIRYISRLICLDPYDRAYKECRHRMHLDRFCDAFQYAIDHVLRFRLSEHERAELYAFTVEALTPFIRETQWGTVIDISPREFMQVLGTEGGQRVRPSLWVDLATSQWLEMPGTVLVPDVRFKHEMDVLDTLVIVSRVGIALPTDSHVSERLALRLTVGHAIDDPVFPPIRRLYNAGSLADFEEAAQRLARRLMREGATID